MKLKMCPKLAILTVPYLVNKADEGRPKFSVPKTKFPCDDDVTPMDGTLSYIQRIQGVISPQDMQNCQKL